MLKRIRDAGKFVALTGCLDGPDAIKMVLDELGPEEADELLELL